MIFYDVTGIEDEQEKERKVHKELSERYEKEKKTREVLANLLVEPKNREILEAASRILGKDSGTMNNLERIAQVMQEKKVSREIMQKEIIRDKEDLEGKTREIENINRQLVQKELKMVELKEKIKEDRG